MSERGANAPDLYDDLRAAQNVSRQETARRVAAEAERDALRAVCESLATEIERREAYDATRERGGMQPGPSAAGDLAGATPSVMAVLARWLRRYRALGADRDTGQ